MTDYPQRKSIRLKGYDYSQAGAYFITICTQNRLHLFGDIVDGVMILNDAGKIIERIWQEIPHDFSNIHTDTFIIMPNHVHGIITVGADSISARDSKRAEIDSAPTTPTPPTIGTVVQSFKRHTTIRYIQMVKQNILPRFKKCIWQRNYWEHIVRNEQEFERITQYIRNNPAYWQHDSLHTHDDHQIREPQSEYGQEVWMI